MSLALRIVKVGGSLFTLPDLAQRLRRWLGQQSPARNVLLAGGGALADHVRRWDGEFSLGEERSHWLCIDVLDITAQLLSAVLPEAQLCRDDAALSLNDSHETIVLAPGQFVREREAHLPGLPLPRSWDATSDSIAARLAEISNAVELVLLKSSLPNPGVDWTELTGNYVDRHFIQAAAHLRRVRFVDLRHERFAELLARS
jgi:aspartokinase-like uncharacterized kinase